MSSRRDEKGETIRFGVSMSAELLSKFDEFLAKKGYASRSEAIRDMIRNELVEEQWRVSDGEVVGTLTIVYSHHVRGLKDELLELQHKYQNLFLATTHVHLDEENCVEVMILKGSPTEAKMLADKLISLKGVKHGRLSLTTTGTDIP